jgi:hypothetical protein
MIQRRWRQLEYLDEEIIRKRMNIMSYPMNNILSRLLQRCFLFLRLLLNLFRSKHQDKTMISALTIPRIRCCVSIFYSFFRFTPLSTFCCVNSSLISTKGGGIFFFTDYPLYKKVFNARFSEVLHPRLALIIRCLAALFNLPLITS